MRIIAAALLLISMSVLAANGYWVTDTFSGRKLAGPFKGNDDCQRAIEQMNATHNTSGMLLVCKYDF
jgi:hypothetical protein